LLFVKDSIIYMSFSWPDLRTTYALVADVGQSVLRPLSFHYHGHISKIKQERPTVTTYYYKQ